MYAILHGPTNEKKLKASEQWLCGFDRVWWKMKNCILTFEFPGQVFLSPYFLILGGSLILTRCAISLKYVPKIQKFNNLSKTGSFVEIFQREPKKICLVTPKNVKNWQFLLIFSTKTRHIFAVVQATSIKVGFKIKYNCYIW
jgi:hypothetical protein